ncbi:MAG TPA: hypothetical protein VGF01_20805 [Terracidiphilus sp.]|jgi:hypothetical protein
MSRISVSLLAALVLAPLASAQRPVVLAAQPAASSTPDPAIHAVISAVMPRAANWGAVKSLPFSATETTTREQTLSDGTVIKSTVEVLFSRDSEGRLRADAPLKPDANGASQGRIVTLWNPNDGRSITWITGNPSATFASVTHLPESQLNSFLSTLATTPATSARTPLQRSLTASLASAQDSSSLQAESLPEQSIAGVQATGARITQVIPAGTVDNDRDFTIVSETWTSADLKTTVRQVSSDPRTGTVTTELSNIDRTEPDPALFKVPANVRVTDLPEAIPAVQKRF